MKGSIHAGCNAKSCALVELRREKAKIEKLVVDLNAKPKDNPKTEETIDRQLRRSSEIETLMMAIRRRGDCSQIVENGLHRKNKREAICIAIRREMQKR